MNPNASRPDMDVILSGAKDPRILSIDATIDSALSTLAAAQPRPGLNTRILASLEQRAAAPATNPGGLPFHSLIVKGWGIVRGSERENVAGATRLALWSAASAAVLAVVPLLLVHFHAASKPKETASLQTRRIPGTGIDSPQPLAGRTSSISRHPERSAPARSRRSPVFTNCADQPHTGCPVHDEGAAVGMSGMTTTADLDAQALADLHAPSHPAPPLPLTTQEKLFIRMTRYANATELAELNPAVRAQHDADETAAFKSFFPEPPPLKQPGDDE